jgi:hypothetical protein
MVVADTGHDDAGGKHVCSYAVPTHLHRQPLIMAESAAFAAA